MDSAAELAHIITGVSSIRNLCQVTYEQGVISTNSLGPTPKYNCSHLAFKILSPLSINLVKLREV